MSKSLPRPLLFFCLLAALPQLGWGTPSGLKNIPTTDTTPQGTFVFQLFSTVGDNRDADLNYGFKTGLDAKFVKFELGSSGHLYPDDVGPATFHGKVAVPLGGWLPTLAVGSANATLNESDRHRAGEPFSYFVASEDLKIFRVHAGVGYQNGSYDTKLQPFFGLDKTFKMTRKRTAAVSDSKTVRTTRTTETAEGNGPGSGDPNSALETRDLFTFRTEPIERHDESWLYSAGVLIPVTKFSRARRPLRHIILPVASGFEMDGVYMRRDDRSIRWQHAAVPRLGKSKTDIEIWIDLAAAMAKLDKSNPPEYWTDNLRADWKSYPKLWAEFVANTPGVGGMTQARMEKRAEPLRWPCPTEKHPGVSTLYLDHPSWYEAAESLDSKNKGKRFLTGSGKIEIFTPELDAKLAKAGHHALPIFYTHPEVTGKNPSITYSNDLVENPINPGSVTPNVTIGGMSDGAVHAEFPLMGMVGRASVVHFAGITQWTYVGKQMNGIRLVQIHPKAAEKSGVADGDKIVVESPRGSVTGTALLWDGIREDTIFVPNSFGPAQAMGDEFGEPRYEPANILLDDRYFDNLSGQQAYKCFACRVKKA